MGNNTDITRSAVVRMTRSEATEFILAAGEDDGPETYEDAAEIFAAIIGRAPDASDGDRGDLWSHACAAVATAHSDIRQLLREAEGAGDGDRVAICRIALDGASDSATAQVCREECARVIRAARAMEDRS